MELNGDLRTMTKSDEVLSVHGCMQGSVPTKCNDKTDQPKTRSCPSSLCSAPQDVQNGPAEDGIQDMEHGLEVVTRNGISCCETDDSLQAMCRRPASPVDVHRDTFVVHDGDEKDYQYPCLCKYQEVTTVSMNARSRNGVQNVNSCGYDGDNLSDGLAPYSICDEYKIPGLVHPNNDVGDDMEGYFNANAHMLQSDMEASSHGIEEDSESDHTVSVHQNDITDDSNEALTYGYTVHKVNLSGDHNVAQVQGDDGDDGNRSDSLHEEGFFEEINYAQTRIDGQDTLNGSFEDGDFIEPDIPRNAFGGYGSSSSNSRNSTTSSYEELPTVITECDLRRNGVAADGEEEGGQDDAAAFSLETSSCTSCGGVSIDARGRPSSLNTRPHGGSTNGCSSQPQIHTPASSESSFKTTSSSFQSPQLSDSSVFCGCTPDSNSFPSHEDFLDSDLGSTWSRHTSHSSASNLPCAETSSCANGESLGCLCHTQSDLLMLPSDSHSHTRLAPYTSVSGASACLVNFPHHVEHSNLDQRTRKVHGSKIFDGKDSNCDSSNVPHGGATMSAEVVQHRGNQLDFVDGAGMFKDDTCPMHSPVADPFDDDGSAPDHSSNIVDNVHEQPGLLNVSRQTSTSNFDQDENSFQEDGDDHDLCQVCHKHLALSDNEGDEEGEKQTNHDHGTQKGANAEGPSLSPMTESNCSGGRIRRSQSAPGDARRSGSLASLCLDFAQASRQHNTLPG